MMTTHSRRLTLLAALLGWMFDGMEMGLFPLVARDALAELLKASAKSPQVDLWYSLVMAAFLVGAATGGVLFGWLGDKLGRVKAMTFSVLLYSLASGLSALAQDPWSFAILRFLGALGMGGEWALGVALVMEAYGGTNRAWLAAMIGAFGNLGYTLCGLIKLGLNHYDGFVVNALSTMGFTDGTVLQLKSYGYWRVLMMIGALPALLTFLIRLFVPESEKWGEEKASGRAKAWSTFDLLFVLLGAGIAGCIIYLWSLGEVSIIMKAIALLIGLVLIAACYLIPAMRYGKRVGLSAELRQFMRNRMLLAAALSGVALLGTWCAVMWMYLWVGTLPGGSDPDCRPILQIYSSLGAAFGCAVGAWLCDVFNRRIIYAILCISSVASILGFYTSGVGYGYSFLILATLMSIFTAAFYGWLPLYLPELFPTAVRATGQGFGFNFGRILAAAGSLQMKPLLEYFNNDYSKACAIVPIVYVIGLLVIYFAPETKGRPLPD